MTMARKVTAVVCCVLLALIAASAAMAQDAGKGPLPMPLGHGAAVVESGSMEPTMPKGSLLLLESPGALGVGDVVVYEAADGYVVHRVVAVEGSQLICKGDANDAADAPVSAAAVVAVVVGCVPVLGGVIGAVGAPAAMLVIAAAAAALLLMAHRRPGAARHQASGPRGQ